MASWPVGPGSVCVCLLSNWDYYFMQLCPLLVLVLGINHGSSCLQVLGWQPCLSFFLLHLHTKKCHSVCIVGFFFICQHLKLGNFHVIAGHPLLIKYFKSWWHGSHFFLSTVDLNWVTVAIFRCLSFPNSHLALSWFHSWVCNCRLKLVWAYVWVCMHMCPPHACVYAYRCRLQYKISFHTCPQLLYSYVENIGHIRNSGMWLSEGGLDCYPSLPLLPTQQWRHGV